MSKEDIITDFNGVLLDLAKNFADVSPTSIVGTNIKEIERQILKKSNRTKFIDLFCVKVLQYKDKIDNGEDEFFLKKNYDKDLQDVENGGFVGHVFEFKNIWNELTENNKHVVREYMKLLCSLAQDYFLLCC